MKKVSSLFFLVILLVVFSFAFVPKTFSDELDELNKKINDLNEALNMSKAATAPLETQLKSMQSQITEIKASVAFIEKDILTKKKNIDNGYKNLEKQEKILNHTIRDFYIKSYYSSPLLVFLSATSASEITQILAYQKAATDQDKAIITNIAISIADLEIKKKNLESEQTRLVAVKQNLDEQSSKLDGIVKGAKDYQKTLTSQIAQLSQKQQELLAQKLGSLNLPKSAYTMQGGCSSDIDIDPGFSPRFALFTFGVPHRVGMSQYGAKGRADTGASYEAILSFYFLNTQISDTDPNAQIKVVGTNEYGQNFNGDDGWDLETYVKHIYEMPTNWPMNALKAQAIAARSYAVATKTSISGASDAVCPSQSCQVVKKEINSGEWQQAVDETRGKILTNNGNAIQAWFSSTAGGYTFGSGDVWGGGNKPWTKNSFDTAGSVSSFDDLKNNAYDKESKWFYCDWGARSQYNKTAWLKPEEIADIVNVLLLAKKDSSAQKHLSQTDKPNPDGVDTWDAQRVKQELGGGAFNSISDISISADFGSGRTTTVTVSGDGKSESFNGSDFKTYFNLRAPANINIVGPLYNVEKR